MPGQGQIQIAVERGISFREMFVKRTDVGPHLHFDAGEVIAYQGFERLSAVQKGAPHRDAALVVEGRDSAEIRRDPPDGDGVVKVVAVPRVTVMDLGRYHDVPQPAHHRGRFAQDENPPKPLETRAGPGKQMLGGQSQRIFQVDHPGAALRQRRGKIEKGIDAGGA